MIIRPLAEKVCTAAHTRRLKTVDIVIFISKNAVIYSCDLFPYIVDILQEKTVLAVGRATAGCLLALGLKWVECIDAGGSEALLNLPALTGMEVRGKRILILRGQGGREELRERLLARNAAVDYLEVYRREKPDISQADMVNFWHDETPDALIITSLAGLDNLVELTPDAEIRRLYGTGIVVMSERIKQHALEVGFLRIAVATDSSDAGLLDALLSMSGG